MRGPRNVRFGGVLRGVAPSAGELEHDQLGGADVIDQDSEAMRPPPDGDRGEPLVVCYSEGHCTVNGHELTVMDAAQVGDERPQPDLGNRFTVDLVLDADRYGADARGNAALVELCRNP